MLSFGAETKIGDNNNFGDFSSASSASSHMKKGRMKEERKLSDSGAIKICYQLTLHLRKILSHFLSLERAYVFEPMSSLCRKIQLMSRQVITTYKYDTTASRSKDADAAFLL